MTDTLRPARDAAPRMLSYEDDRASYAPEVPERFNPVPHASQADARMSTCHRAIRDANTIVADRQRQLAPSPFENHLRRVGVRMPMNVHQRLLRHPQHCQ